jgi:nascent polypeptide-associated complex subunit alpha
MIPGLGGKGSAREMNRMMQRLGIQVKDIPDVREVVIKTSTKVYTFREANVTVMDAQGQKTYQLTGKATVRDITAEERGALGAPAAPVMAEEDEDEETIEGSLEDVALEISDEDVALVASQTGKTPREARAALEAVKGDIAEAIVRLSA